MPGTKLIHRAYWKYQSWLHGFNGGPLRYPTQKMIDAHMRNLRAAVKAMRDRLEEEKPRP